MRRAAPALVALALGLLLAGCETTAEKSAKLEKAAHAAAARLPTAKGLSISRASTRVKVLGVAIVHSSEGSAAAVTVRNVSSQRLHELPLALTVRDAGGATVYSNSAPGLAPSLVSVSSLAPGAELTWVDDQVQTTGTATSASAVVGEGKPVSGTLPAIAVSEGKLFEDPTNGIGAEGMVVNHSGVQQQELVVYGVARRGGRIVAAGRAVVPLLAAGASTRFQIFFVGSPQGAQLQFGAPASTIG